MSQEERRQMDKTERLSELQAAFEKDPKAGLIAYSAELITQGKPLEALKIIPSDYGELDGRILRARALFDSMKHPAETDEFIKIIRAERGVEDDVGAQRLFGEYAFDKGNTDDAKTHLKKAYELDSNHYHTAELLRALGEDVELPEQLEDADEDYESIVGESLNDEESVGKTLGQIALTALICGGLAFGYYYKAKRDFRASELAVEAKPMVTAGDRGSLKGAIENYETVVNEISSTSAAVSGLALADALLWIEHGLAEYKPQALGNIAEAREQNFENADRYAADILIYTEEGLISEAQRVAKDVSSRGAVSDKLAYALGYSLLREGKLEQAAENLRRAHDTNASSPYYATRLAEALWLDGDRSNAKLYLKKAVRANANFMPGIAMGIADRALRGRATADDQKKIDGIITSQPIDTLGTRNQNLVYFAAAALAYNNGNLEESQKFIKLSLGADPLSPFATVHQATLLAHKGELDPAAELFRQAVKNVSCTYTTDALINFYAKYEKFDDAIAVLDGMGEDDKKAAKYLTIRGDVLRYKGDAANSKAAYDKALEARREYPMALLGQALLEVKGRNNEKAIEWFEKAAGAREVFPEVYEGIGLLFISLGDLTGGLKQLEVAEQQFIKRGTSKVILGEFYDRVIKETARRSSSTAAKWQSKKDELLKQPS